MKREYNEREQFSQYNERREAKLRDKERGQARKVKNAFRQAFEEASKDKRRDG